MVSTMVPVYLIALSAVLCLAAASPVSYQYVRFVRRGHDSPQRRSRSFGFSKQIVTESHIYDGFPGPNSIGFEENRGHITPDFSNGLDYPDPLLLRGPSAKRTASFLYRKPLFYSDINHVDLLMENQEIRRRNGLSGNKLGSLRPSLPFYRFNSGSRFFRYF